MEQKAVNNHMKRSESELALQEVINNTSIASNTHSNITKDDNNNTIINSFAPEILDDFLSDILTSADMVNVFSTCGGLTESLKCSQNMTPKQSSLTVPIDAQSSICVSSLTPVNKPKAQSRDATSGYSSPELSEDEDVDTEAGPCEQSTNPVELKRIRRMVSNRESARRSRRKKQLHLADLECQVEQLSGENASLFKQLSSTTQQYRDADTNNRVLKSNVEALRAKVKLAEDLVFRGSVVTCSLNQLIQNHLTPHQPIGNLNLRRPANVSPSITVHGDDASYGGITVSGQNSGLGLGNPDVTNGSLNTGVMSDAVSCVTTDIWP